MGEESYCDNICSEETAYISGFKMQKIATIIITKKKYFNSTDVHYSKTYFNSCMPIFLQRSGKIKNISVQQLKDATDACISTQSFCIGTEFFQLSNKTQLQLHLTLQRHEQCQGEGITFPFASYPFSIYFHRNMESKKTK